MIWILGVRFLLVFIILFLYQLIQPFTKHGIILESSFSLSVILTRKLVIPIFKVSSHLYIYIYIYIDDILLYLPYMCITLYAELASYPWDNI